MRILLLLAIGAQLQGCVFVVMGGMAVYGLVRAGHQAELCEKAGDRCK
jgi:hypothetical protein